MVVLLRDLKNCVLEHRPREELKSVEDRRKVKSNFHSLINTRKLTVPSAEVVAAAQHAEQTGVGIGWNEETMASLEKIKENLEKSRENFNYSHYCDEVRERIRSKEWTMSILVIIYDSTRLLRKLQVSLHFLFNLKMTCKRKNHLEFAGTELPTSLDLA